MEPKSDTKPNLPSFKIVWKRSSNLRGEIRKKLNLNQYQWWRNHRRIVSFGGALLLFGWWFNPVITESRNKNLCALFFANEIDDLSAAIKLGFYRARKNDWQTSRSKVSMYCHFLKPNNKDFGFLKDIYKYKVIEDPITGSPDIEQIKE